MFFPWIAGVFAENRSLLKMKFNRICAGAGGWKKGIGLLVLFCCLGGAGGAVASDMEVSKGEAQKTANATLLGTVVVTAQKREENVQDVPISMDVFDELQIDDAGITDLKDLTYFSPNLYAKQNINQNMIIIRGLSSHNVVLNTPAGLFVDDINYPITFMQNPDLLDIERIEVLRGPQGTLYGRNTESGAVRIITRTPDNTLRGKIFLEPGLYTTDARDVPLFRAGASFSGPLVEDILYLSGAFQSKDTQGYTENIHDGNKDAGRVDHKSGQAKLRWTPTSRWDVTLLGNVARDDNGYGYVRYIDGPDASDRYQINWDGGNGWVDENNGQALHLKYEGQRYSFSSITTRNDFSTNFYNDGEFKLLPFPDQIFKFETTSYSQEFRVASADGDTPEEASPFEWLVGAFAFHDDNVADASFMWQFRETDFENTGCALFGQASYRFLEKWKATAGLRWDRQESHGDQTRVDLNQSYSADIEHDEFLPKVSLSYDVDERVMLYATVAKGILAGGFDYGFATSDDTLTFEPETTWNYEAGVKSQWFDDRLTVNLTAFYIDIQDKQVEEFLAGPSVRSVTNAARASSKGLELEVQARPSQEWKLFGGLGYADARIESWESDEMGGGTYDYSGNRLTYAPEYTYNVGAEYAHSSGLFVRGDLVGVGDFYTDAKNETKVEGYGLVNLRVGYRREAYDVVLWCKNAFDEAYYTSKSYYIGGHIVGDGAPRTVGLTVTYRF